MTLGSLFDGIGGFPLAGVMCGITPVWSSEIEPFPLKVTAARFPEVEQIGSVTEIDGGSVEPVDIITFGSPCQDLSVAGKQLGIHEGQRSNLFFEAVRIIKEMRNADTANGRTGKHIRPRFAVWENVPGAFSSNKGADFQAVLQALASVRENGVSIPQPKKWGGAGCVVGNGWSLAWRVYNAQYWGVPQRRKRIYLVADFGSERAGEILFEREGVSGDSSESGTAGKGTAADAERGIGRSSLFEPMSLMEENWSEQTVKNALRANASKSGSCVVEPICLNFQGNKGGCSTTQDGTAYSLNAMHGHDVHVIADRVRCLNPWDSQSIRQYDINGVGPNINANSHGGQNRWGVCYALKGNFVDRDTRQNGMGWRLSEMYTLDATDRHGVCYPEIARSLCARADSSSCIDRGQNVVCYDARGNGDGNTIPTLTGDHQNRITDYTAICVGNGQLHQTDLGDKAGTLNCMHDQQAVITNGEPPRKYIVRRLTPTECARLQGFPDEWCDGLGGSDSAIYKAYGNGLALPCAVDVLRRIAKEYDQTAL